MDAGNERDDQAGVGESTQAWMPDSEETGWGRPAGSVEDPGPARRRPVKRSTPGLARSGWDRDPADWRPANSEGDQAGADSRSAPPTWAGGSEQPGGDPGQAQRAGEGFGSPGWPSEGESPSWSGWQTDDDDWSQRPVRALSDSGPDPRFVNPDGSDLLPPSAPEGTAKPVGGFFDNDQAYPPEAPYGAGGGQPVGTPSVWGTSYDPGEAYYEEDEAYPDDGYVDDGYGKGGYEDAGWGAEQVPRRRVGVIAAATVGALVLIGGGVAAAVTLTGQHNSPAATSPPFSSLPTNRASHGATPTSTPATNAAPSTSSPTATSGTTLPSTTPATSGSSVALSTWTNQELDLILQIKTDLTTLNRDLDVGPDFSILTIDATDLQQDLQAADSAPAPADAAVAQEWTQLLHDLASSNNALDGAIQSQDPNIALDLQRPVTITDTDYNNLSQTLNQDSRHADHSGSGQSND